MSAEQQRLAVRALSPDDATENPFEDSLQQTVPAGDAFDEPPLQLDAIEPDFGSLPSPPAPRASYADSHSHLNQAAAVAHFTHAAPLALGSHGAAAVQGIDITADLDDEVNPFDTPHLPAHSRTHLDSAPMNGHAANRIGDTSEEVVPTWRQELRTLLTLAVPAVLINLTSAGLMVVSQMLTGHISVEALAASVCSTMYFNLAWCALRSQHAAGSAMRGQCNSD